MTPANDNRPRPAWYDEKLLAHDGYAHKCAYHFAVGDDHDDVMQDYYEQAFRRWPLYQTESQKFTGWVRNLMRYTCYERRRARAWQKRAGQTVEMPETLSTPAAQHDRAELSETLARLSGTRDSEALLRFAAGEPFAEIADEWGISRERVRQLADRERARLKGMADAA
jgi:RNA polymerase sigma factor (sigma-70 family)